MGRKGKDEPVPKKWILMARKMGPSFSLLFLTLLLLAWLYCTPRCRYAANTPPSLLHESWNAYYLDPLNWPLILSCFLLYVLSFVVGLSMTQPYLLLLSLSHLCIAYWLSDPNNEKLDPCTVYLVQVLSLCPLFTPLTPHALRKVVFVL
jgi:hypothetical protein